MKLVGKSSIDDVTHKDISSLIYQQMGENDEWKVKMATELIDIKAGNLNIPTWTKDELDEVLNLITTQ